MKSLFAQASLENKWSPPVVKDSAGKRTFVQHEVPHEGFPDAIKELMKRALERSGDGGRANSVEAGFIVVHKKSGGLLCAEVTSNNHMWIFHKDTDPALDALVTVAGAENVQRVQFYHTHPRGPAQRSLSTADVDATLRDAARLAAKGVRADFDMHALPYDISLPQCQASSVEPVALRITLPCALQ